MIYSVTLFGDLPHERELLRIRLEEELPFVDKFIVVESNRKHSGELKPYGLSELPDVLSNPKVDCRLISVDTQANRKLYYSLQANLTVNEFNADDIIIHSDLDEVNDRRDMPAIIAGIAEHSYARLSLHNHQYFINYFADNWQRRWLLGFGCTGAYLKANGNNFHKFRYDGNAVYFANKIMPIISTRGHHFSYILTVEQIIDKLRHTCDTCFSKEFYMDPEFIRTAIVNGCDVLKRNNQAKVWHSQPMSDDYPKSLLDNMDYWRPWVAKCTEV